LRRRLLPTVATRERKSRQGHDPHAGRDVRLSLQVMPAIRCRAGQSRRIPPRIGRVAHPQGRVLPAINAESSQQRRLSPLFHHRADPQIGCVEAGYCATQPLRRFPPHRGSAADLEWRITPRVGCDGMDNRQQVRIVGYGRVSPCSAGASRNRNARCTTDADRCMGAARAGCNRQRAVIARPA
jgi:hypothetical protein